jgi:hypothetical protein
MSLVFQCLETSMENFIQHSFSLQTCPDSKYILNKELNNLTVIKGLYMKAILKILYISSKIK